MEPPTPGTETPEGRTRAGIHGALALGIFVLGIILGAAGVLGYQRMNRPHTPVDSYDTCVAAPGSRIQESYPPTCVTRDGQRFPQIIPETPVSTPSPSVKPMCGGIAGIRCPDGFVCKIDGEHPDAGGVCVPSGYTCPKSAWVDCMPGPLQGIKQECTPDYLSWAKINCPGFEGAAY